MTPRFRTGDVCLAQATVYDVIPSKDWLKPDDPEYIIATFNGQDYSAVTSESRLIASPLQTTMDLIAEQGFETLETHQPNCLAIYQGEKFIGRVSVCLRPKQLDVNVELYRSYQHLVDLFRREGIKVRVV